MKKALQLRTFNLTNTVFEDDPLADLTPQEFQVVYIYFQGEHRTIKSIAELVGLHPDTVSRILNKEEVKDCWARMRGIYYQNMASAATKGSELVHEIIDSEEASYNERLKALSMATTAAGVNFPESTKDEGTKGRRVSLSEAVAAIIEEAAEYGKRKMIEDNIINLDDKDGHYVS